VYRIYTEYMHDKSVILLFIKAPVRGQVKSRLAAAIGDEAALELYKSFILDIIDAVKKTGYPFRICYYPPDSGKAVASWLGVRYRFMPQHGNDLGERMENAFIRCFSEGFERAILIGSDLPDLAPAVLREAISSLAENDVVIGPASDGGYYLIGFHKRTFLPGMFHGITWSVGTVFQETMTILQNSALTVHQAPKWNDVDTVEDLKALCKRGKDTEFDKSRTMTYLINNEVLVKALES
jgi:rSAM/selenodomain-associated transferase 1